MTRLFKYMILALLFMAAPSDAGRLDYIKGAITQFCSGDYGMTVSGDTPHAMEQYRGFLSKVTLDCHASSGTFYAYLYDADTSDREVKFAIYDDDGGSGEPGTKLWEGAALYDAASAGTLHWLDQAFSGISLSSGDYYIGVMSESNAGTDMRYTAASGTSRYDDQGSFAWPATWDESGDTHSTALYTWYIGF